MLNKNVPIYHIDLLSRTRSKQFYLETMEIEAPPRPVLTGKSVADCPAASVNNLDLFASQSTAADDAPNNLVPVETSGHSDRSKKVMLSWLTRNDPFLIQGDVFKSQGTESGSTQARIKKDLIADDWIKVHKLSSGKSSSSVWEPTAKAYARLGLSSPRYHSKGGYLHQFCAWHFKKWATQRKYTVDVEFMLGNGKAVDLFARKDGQATFVEVAMSYPLEKEISNIVKDFASELQPDRLLVAVKDRRMKVAMEKLIAADSRVEEYRGKLQVVLAGDYIVRS